MKSNIKSLISLYQSFSMSCPRITYVPHVFFCFSDYQIKFNKLIVFFSSKFHTLLRRSIVSWPPGGGLGTGLCNFSKYRNNIEKIDISIWNELLIRSRFDFQWVFKTMNDISISNDFSISNIRYSDFLYSLSFNFWFVSDIKVRYRNSEIAQHY